jgi:hypothetical protein
MPAASIIVELLMKTASFITDNERAAKSLVKLKKEAYDTGRQIGDSLNSVGSAIGITLTIAGLTALVKSSIDAADHLNDLSKRTGVTVETLGGLGFAASNAGSDLDSIAAGAGKLNKQLAAAASGNEDAVDLFKTLGINIRDTAGQLKTADAVILEMADHFAAWGEGPEKGALAVRAFGKAGEALIPVLDEGAESLRASIAYYQRYAGVTTSVAQRADALNDTFGKLSLLTSAFGRNLASELLTPLQAVADELLSAKEKGDGMRSTAEGLATAFEALVRTGAFLATGIAIVGDTLGGLAAQMSALFRIADARSQNMTLMDRLVGRAPMLTVQQAQSAVGQLGAIGDAAVEDYKKNIARLDSLNAAMDRRNAEKGQRNIEDRGFVPNIPGLQKPRAPLLPDKGAAGQAAAEAQKIYDAQVQAARDFGAAQRAAFAFQNKQLDAIFDQGLTSLRSFYEQEAEIREGALRAQLQAIDAEIAARRKESQDSRLSPVQRLDAVNKLQDAERKRAEAVVEGSRDATLARLSEQKAFEQYAGRFVELQAQIADATGDDRLAASLRISRQILETQRLLTAIGADPGLADQLRRQLEARADLAQVQEDYSRLVERSANAEATAVQQAQAGNKGELDTMRAIGAERAKSLVQLGALVDRATELALANPTKEAIANAERLSAAYQKAAAELDPVLQHIRDVGGQVGQTIADGFADALLEGDSFIDTLHGIDKALARIALNELFSKPFGNWLSGLVGGNGQSSGGGGWIGAVGNWLAGAFGGGMADGGPTMPNTLYRVGERGPELYDDGRHQLLLTGAGRGRIDPNPRLGGASGPPLIVNQQFTLQGRQDRSTQQQIGARAARGLRLANARGN